MDLGDSLFFLFSSSSLFFVFLRISIVDETARHETGRSQDEQVLNMMDTDKGFMFLRERRKISTSEANVRQARESVGRRPENQMLPANIKTLLCVIPSENVI